MGFLSLQINLVIAPPDVHSNCHSWLSLQIIEMLCNLLTESHIVAFFTNILLDFRQKVLCSCNKFVMKD